MPLGNQEYIRDMNSRLVLREIIHNEPISRAEISKNLGLTKATVSSIVQSLIDNGQVEEIGSLNTHKGRKPILLKFIADCAYTLSVYLDVNATTILIADLQGAHRQIFTFEGIADLETPAQKLCAYIEEAASHCPKSRYGIIGIAIGVLGVVLNNHIQFTPYYQLEGPELGSYIEEYFNIPVHIENEANLSARTEQTFFHNCANLINVNIHAGIGMGIVINHHLHRGLNGFAGEFGHTIIEPDGKPCPCGNRGCIEQYASKRAIVNLYREKSGKPRASAHDLCEAYLQGEPEAITAIQTFTKYMAIGLNNILNIFNPDIVIINSVFTAKIPGLIDCISDEMKNRFNKGCHFVPAALDQETSILLGGCCVCARSFLKLKDLHFLWNE